MSEQKLKKKIISEIFSEGCNFHLELLVSGRSAIDFALKDLIIKNKIDTALLPDYICESMIEPFIKNCINIEFYSVNFENGEFIVDYSTLCNRENTCVLICDYFKPNNEIYNSIIKQVSEKNHIIHDITHTLFSNDVNVSLDDYTVCSLRKWFDIIDGGLVIGKQPFKINKKEEHSQYIENKTASRKLKKEYYNNPTKENKKLYKYYYNLSDEILNNDFSLYTMSQKSIEQVLYSNFFKIKKDRQYLFKEICQILSKNGIEVIKNIDIFNCLFTIPIVVENRDEVIEKFYNNLIRCAVFWEYNEYNKDRQNNFIDNGICLSISENTSKQLKKILK